MDKIEETLNTLEKIFEQYEPSSPEAEAILLAANALTFTRSREIREKFLQYIRNLETGELTDMQLRWLEYLGVDPHAEN